MPAADNLKFAVNPTPSTASGNQKTRERPCAWCELPIKGHPVLLRSGRSVHLECYFWMQKRPESARTN